mmetsp:Transcript_22579/g.27594  ORF Transcript_22579/g.27594 Transcript_22579/m.27594 type:complete len:291 (+) Transcript_22579:74-946(+)
MIRRISLHPLAIPFSFFLLALSLYSKDSVIVKKLFNQRLLLSGVSAFEITFTTPPVFGLGSIFSKPSNAIQPCRNTDDLKNAGAFFTDAFWTDKVGGGSKKLSTPQKLQLQRQQISEFQRRYGFFNDQAKLITCQSAATGKIVVKKDIERGIVEKGDEIMGCIGVEIDDVFGKRPDRAGKEKQIEFAPLMSNLAVGRTFRRKGLAEDLVTAVETMVRKEWGYNSCYLYVEKRNKGAVKLYKKMGYWPIWENKDATTLLPTDNGRILETTTTLVCMKKNLKLGLLSRFVPF